MLWVNRYQKEYVAECRSRVESQLACYKTVAAAMKAGKPAPVAAMAGFEPMFFNNLVVVLDGFFVHRNRTLEQGDGNPLNEVRMLCRSILHDRGVLAADTTIQYDPSKAVLKLEIGWQIKMAEADFIRLFKAFFDGIEARYM